MSLLNPQKGITHFGLILVLVLSIAAGTILVQERTSFNPRADEWFREEQPQPEPEQATPGPPETPIEEIPAPAECFDEAGEIIDCNPEPDNPPPTIEPEEEIPETETPEPVECFDEAGEIIDCNPEPEGFFERLWQGAEEIFEDAGDSLGNLGESIGILDADARMEEEIETAEQRSLNIKNRLLAELTDPELGPDNRLDLTAELGLNDDASDSEILAALNQQWLSSGIRVKGSSLSDFTVTVDEEPNRLALFKGSDYFAADAAVGLQTGCPTGQIGIIQTRIFCDTSTTTPTQSTSTDVLDQSDLPYCNTSGGNQANCQPLPAEMPICNDSGGFQGPCVLAPEEILPCVKLGFQSECIITTPQLPVCPKSGYVPNCIFIPDPPDVGQQQISPECLDPKKYLEPQCFNTGPKTNKPADVLDDEMPTFIPNPGGTVVAMPEDEDDSVYITFLPPGYASPQGVAFPLDDYPELTQTLIDYEPVDPYKKLATDQAIEQFGPYVLGKGGAKIALENEDGVVTTLFFEQIPANTEQLQYMLENHETFKADGLLTGVVLKVNQYGITEVVGTQSRNAGVPLSQYNLLLTEEAIDRVSDKLRQYIQNTGWGHGDTVWMIPEVRNSLLLDRPLAAKEWDEYFLNEGNILIDPYSGEITLIDFHGSGDDAQLGVHAYNRFLYRADDPYYKANEPRWLKEALLFRNEQIRKGVR